MEKNLLKLAVPDNKIYKDILANIDSFTNKSEIKIIRTSEKECAELLLSSKVDAALLSPFGYAKGLFDSDFRIIPGPAMLSEGFSKAGTIIISSSLKSAKYFASDFPDDFIIHIGKLLLGERYNMFPAIEMSFSSFDEMINGCDIVITKDGEKEGRITLDVSEEWFDMNETALPLAFWVCKAEEAPQNILKIVSLFASETEENNIIEELPPGKDFEPRKGKMSLRWNDDFEHALEFTLHFLFYHQLIKEIPAVKVLGRD